MRVIGVFDCRDLMEPVGRMEERRTLLVNFSIIEYRNV